MHAIEVSPSSPFKPRPPTQTAFDTSSRPLTDVSNHPRDTNLSSASTTSVIVESMKARDSRSGNVYKADFCSRFPPFDSLQGQVVRNNDKYSGFQHSQVTSSADQTHFKVCGFDEVKGYKKEAVLTFLSLSLLLCRKIWQRLTKNHLTLIW
jgi:hypothetical protein